MRNPCDGSGAPNRNCRSPVHRDMAPSAGFEPALSRSTGGCIRPGYAKTALMAGGLGLEPSAFPLTAESSHPGKVPTRIGLERSARIELASDAWKAPAQPLDQPRFKEKAVLPVQHRLGGLRVTLYASPAPRAGSSGASGLGLGVWKEGLSPRSWPPACAGGMPESKDRDMREGFPAQRTRRPQALHAREARIDDWFSGKGLHRVAHATREIVSCQHSTRLLRNRFIGC
jgi:hypothetical protein